MNNNAIKDQEKDHNTMKAQLNVMTGNFSNYFLLLVPNWRTFFLVMMEVMMTPLLIVKLRRMRITKKMRLKLWAIQVSMRTHPLLLIEVILTFKRPNRVCYLIPWSCYLPPTKHRETFNTRLWLHPKTLMWTPSNILTFSCPIIHDKADY